ncbi:MULTISPECIES: tRNA pseudouridine(38-40) synthase TruA [Commensalibacter]|uniref:tRNA pseudouridine synthase A n=1 Tax=Commensalibacter melissae TaxID=2070537 RepID=A0A318N380_9PROT|nr:MULTISPECIES: tRNA pseudouridine(38-40) synthase TruA [Commensalibacter]MCT6841685.1 tRNA pseudouridine(38-40) synthase TruA [Commensalibacter sp.]AYN86983.1 tRNA pseudouridine(38-40) synthase TruA [Commensalibacter melissae]MBH9972943.1 tRNA pseudouridine(38-40) synthase TruA [Commensalibacter melissae]MBI0016526.1 tRNA pseudouridine(38-40) synthase TruA [Commensalibacter sp. B14384M2]MBI0018273.1 tRNA pseudouridine(38-40) synthase TruA [Commensalibacter sp. W8133]
MNFTIQRWAVKIEYDGTGLVGWQRQDNGLSVQQILEEAACKLCNGQFKIASITAGRTDAGVHALGQVAHLDFPAHIPLTAKKIRDGLNYYMKPHAVTILQSGLVDAEWNARFSAIKRKYIYVILNRQSRPALDINHVWHVRKKLNVDAMNEAAQTLLGSHDFTSFRATACQAKSPIRILDKFNVYQIDDKIYFETQARSFLHHQVRNMVGTLKMIGDGYWPIKQAYAILQGRDRKLAGIKAPATGLFLKEITYPDDPFQ